MTKGKKADVQFILPEPEPEAAIDILDDEEFEEPPYTSIEHSVASGEGLYTAMSKTKASFEITAFDGKGVRRPYGGDQFAVSVRGAAYVYAKVNDNNDGSYTVEYKPSTSGSYSIAITLAGRSMPGSPFALTVLVPRADASRCSIRGNSLKRVVARAPSSFEVEFSDAFGKVAHAEELDVYVEPRPVPANIDEALPPDVLVWAIVVAPKPLLVRETSALDSQRVGEVPAGALVGVVETLEMEDSTRRARILFNRGAGRVGGTAGSAETPSSTPGGTPFSTARSGGNNTARSSAFTPRGAMNSPGRALSPGRAMSLSSPGRAVSPGRSPRNASPRSRGQIPHLSSPFGGTAARAVGDTASAMTDRPRSAQVPSFMPGALTAREQGEVGWITAAKDGKETIVLRHSKLDASRRQEQMHQWAKQLAAEANRKASETQRGLTAEQLKIAQAGPSCAHELYSDKTGIAFGYGGVDPGTLHAHGRLVKTHTVHYSIGRAGRYLLHVGLRNQKAALPGSPFELTVDPGSAHAVSTKLSTNQLPLKGTVGETGSVRIVTCDRMGNLCIVGGAPVQVDAKTSVLQTSTHDNGDGSYELRWQGEVSGKYGLHVTIDGINVSGSPTELSLLPAKPEVPKCEVSGGGLSQAVAGDPVVVKVLCKDRFSNPTLPGSSLSFGLAIGDVRAAVTEKHEKKDKKDSKNKDADKGEASDKTDKKGDASDEGAYQGESIEFEGKWLEDGEYEIRYSAKKAGDFELHLWCDTDGDGVRQKLPGSPYLLHVNAAKASAAGSRVTGAEHMRELTAGDRLELGIQLRDPYQNPCAAPERGRGQRAAAISTRHEDEEGSKRVVGSSPSRAPFSPTGQSAGKDNRLTSIKDEEKPEEGVTAVLMTPSEPMPLTEKLRHGDALGTFSLAYELHVAGKYECHLNLSGSPINGSPVVFMVQPDKPSGRLSTLQSPEMPPIVGVSYELLLIAEDKYSNKLDRGGASVQARALGPSASPAETVDYRNGTYGVRFTAGAVGEYRVEVRLDNVKIKGSPHVIMFTEGTAADKKKAALLQANAPTAEPTFDPLVDASGNPLPTPPPDLEDGSPTGRRTSA